jgi:putative DNA primase/helicase
MILGALRELNRERCNPPLEDDELQKIAESAARYDPAPTNGHGPVRALALADPGMGGSSVSSNFPLTEMGNAERFVERHGQGLRYCHTWKTWLHFDGKRWVEDESGIVSRLAKQTVRSLLHEAAEEDDDERRKAVVSWARKSERRAMIENMLGLAQSELSVLPIQLDADPWLATCENGTLDLRTGLLRPHRPEDFIAKMIEASYDPNAKAPTWERFLGSIMGGKAENVAFLRRAAGYSLTGDVSERVIFILWGGGSNGKTTYLETQRQLLGEYAMQTPSEVLMASRNDTSGSATPELAQLKGARFVVASESEEGRSLAEGRIKNLTGREAISARRLFSSPFRFVPEFKIWLATNYRPNVRGTDLGIWSRIRLVPFTVTIAEEDQDKQLPEKLRAEWPGILAWMVQGCLEWQRDGLGVPEDVREATEAYRSDMDVLGQFLADCCVASPTSWVPAADLFEAYKKWCEKAGEYCSSKKALGLRLSERGYEACKVRGTRAWRGIGLRQGADTSDASDAASGNFLGEIPREGFLRKITSNTSNTSPPLVCSCGSGRPVEDCPCEVLV